jgi:WhiB family transcriptional regulator, redox-sensing transcriptional regulator
MERGRPSSSSDEKWRSRASCLDYPPAIFFPSDGVGVDRARRICNQCEVATPCLEFALENKIDHGVWGGTSERQRRRFHKTGSLVEAKLGRPRKK